MRRFYNKRCKKLLNAEISFGRTRTLTVKEILFSRISFVLNVTYWFNPVRTSHLPSIVTFGWTVFFFGTTTVFFAIMRLTSSCGWPVATRGSTVSSATLFFTGIFDAASFSDSFPDFRVAWVTEIIFSPIRCSGWGWPIGFVDVEEPFALATGDGITDKPVSCLLLADFNLVTKKQTINTKISYKFHACTGWNFRLQIFGNLFKWHILRCFRRGVPGFSHRLSRNRDNSGSRWPSLDKRERR